jgi:hypothetical protein
MCGKTFLEIQKCTARIKIQIISKAGIVERDQDTVFFLNEQANAFLLHFLGNSTFHTACY